MRTHMRAVHMGGRGGEVEPQGRYSKFVQKLMLKIIILFLTNFGWTFKRAYFARYDGCVHNF